MTGNVCAMCHRAGNPVFSLVGKHGIKTATVDSDSMAMMSHDGRRLTKGESARRWALYKKFEKHLERFQDKADDDKSVQQVAGGEGRGGRGDQNPAGAIF